MSRSTWVRRLEIRGMVSLSYQDGSASVPTRQALRARMASPGLNWRLILALALNTGLWVGAALGVAQIL